MKLYKLIFIITVISSLLAFACELKRTNPLDPLSHSNINPPNKITGLTASGSGPGVVSKYVELKWTRNDTLNTDGYYIYRGLAYNSAYARIDTLGNISPDTQITRIVPISAPGFYYFKVSAFTKHDIYNNVLDGTLEGPLSEWAIARVDN